LQTATNQKDTVKKRPVVILTKQISTEQYAWRNDPRITAWTRQNGLISEEDQKKWRERISSDPSIQMFGILSPQGLNIGTAGLTSINHIHGTAEFSLFISPKEQGNGYGKSALIELLKYGFKHLRLNLIWGETFHGNQAKAMFQKLGMKEEGRLRERYFKNGEYVDTHMVSLTRNEARSAEWWT